MAKYYDIDNDVRINGKLTVNGDISIPSSNLLVGGNITGNTISGNSAVIANITSTGTISGGTIKGNGATLTVNGTTDNGGTVPISNGWAYTHENKTGSQGHIPTGGSATTFLRGDNTWVVPTDTNNYVTAISSTDGGNGTLSVSRNGLTSLTLDLAHNHDSIYAKLTGSTMSGNILFNVPTYTTANVQSNYIQFAGPSDWHKIYSETYGSTSSRLVIESADDGDADYTTIRSVHYTNGILDLADFKRSTVDINVPLNAKQGMNISGNLSVTGNISVTGTVDGVDIGTHANTTGIGSHIPTGGTSSTFLRGDGTWVTPTDTNTWRPIETSPTTSTTNSISSSWAKIHSETTGLGSHVPTGGSATTFLRGDGTWVTPTDTNTNNYVSSVSSTDGGNGTLTLNRSGLTALTIDLAHNHDSAYLKSTGGNITGAITFIPTSANTWVASVFSGNNTNKSYINFSAASGSNDPGYIMHETSGVTAVANNGVIHLAPTDDNGRGDYVSIHGSNDPETIKIHTDGYVETPSQVKADQGFVVGSTTVIGNDAMIDWARIKNEPSTYAPSSHTHLWADITDKPATYSPSSHTHLWVDITDKPSTFSPSSHTHLWADITDKPTTFNPSSHNHDDMYYTETESDLRFLGISASAVNAEKLDNLDSTQFLRADTSGTMIGALTISGSSATPLILQRNGTSNVNIQFQHNTGNGFFGIDNTGNFKVGSVADLNSSGYKLWHENNFTPSSKLDTTTFATHTGNTGVGSHIPVGGTTSQFLRGDGTWAVPTDTNTNNYTTSISGNGNGTFYLNRSGLTQLTLDLSHTHSQYVTNNSANQSVLTGFTMSGNAYVGTSSTSGALIVRTTSGASSIQLAGDNATQLAGTSVYMNASGNANFSGTVSANALKVTSTGLVSNLNAEMVNGVKEKYVAKNESIYELGGKGVYIGLNVTQQTIPNMTVLVNAGTAYTDSGMRFVFTNTSVSLATSSATYDRKDVVYIQGSSASANEGVINVATGTPASTPVEPSIPSDATKLAVILVPRAIGSIQNTHITDARQWKAVRYRSASDDLQVNIISPNIYSSNVGIANFNVPIKNSGTNTSLTFTAGQTSKTWTHNQNLANYTVKFSCNSFEPHIRWSSKTANAVVVELDDVCETDVIVDVSIEGY